MIDIRKFESNKKPLNSKEHVGVEIECITKLHRDALMLLAAKEGLEKYIQIKDDGSIDPGWDDGYSNRGNGDKHTCEVALISPVDILKENLDKLGKILKDIGAYTNSSCGLHVHLDARKHYYKKMFFNLVRSQNLLYKLVRRERKWNQYCEFHRDDEMESVGNKYSGINWRSYERHKTVEVRLHHGTTDVERIYKWVMLLRNIAHGKFLQRKLFVATPKEIVKELKLSPEAKNLLRGKLSA